MRAVDAVAQALHDIHSELEDLRRITRSLVVCVSDLGRKQEEILQWLKSMASKN